MSASARRSSSRSRTRAGRSTRRAAARKRSNCSAGHARCRPDRHHAPRHRRVRALPHPAPPQRRPHRQVTARNDTHDVVAGLEAGADDYLTSRSPRKSCRHESALLVRIGPIVAGHAQLSFGNLEIVPKRARSCATAPSCTSPRPSPAAVRAARTPVACSAARVARQVWGYDYFGDGRLVDVHVRRLRTKVRGRSGQPRHVVT